MRQRLARLKSWEIGFIVTGLVLLLTLLLALVYRILSILIGDTLTQLLMALAIVSGVAAWGIDAATGLVNERELTAQRKLAEEEGRSL